MALSGVIGILIGRMLNRILSIYFGDNGSNILMAFSGAIIFCAILILIVRKYYLFAIITFVMTIPLIVGGVGLYLDNMSMVGYSILIFFVIFPLIIKILSKLKRNK